MCMYVVYIYMYMYMYVVQIYNVYASGLCMIMYILDSIQPAELAEQWPHVQSHQRYNRLDFFPSTTSCIVFYRNNTTLSHSVSITYMYSVNTVFCFNAFCFTHTVHTCNTCMYSTCTVPPCMHMYSTCTTFPA